MPKRVLEGFDTLKFTDKIEMPDLVDLLSMKYVYRADPEDLYKYGGEIYRHLLNCAPLTHSKKYVIVYTDVRFIAPHICPITTPDWHLDGVQYSYASDDVMHTLVGNSSNLMTEFIEHSVEIEDDEIDIMDLHHMEAREYLAKNKDKFGFKPKEVVPDVFTTFTCRHPHRVGFPKRPELRFFVQIRESDMHKPIEWSRAHKSVGTVSKFINGAEESVRSIEKTQNSEIIIRDRI